MVDVKYASFGMMSNNVFIVTDRASGKSALIDCPEDSEKMKRFIEGFNIEYILLTHGHFDHIGGVRTVKEMTGAKVVISKEDEDMLSSPFRSLAAYSGINQRSASADITVSDNDIIELGESKIRVLATPGHTSGSVCYLVANELFTGDTLFCGSYGRTDFPTGNSKELVTSLKRLFSLNGNYNVYPGHDELSTLDFERESNYEALYLINN